MIKKRKEKFQEYVPVLKRDYDRWRIKREFREHNPIYTELLSIKDEIAALENRPELAYEEKLRLDAILRNRFASLRAQLPARDPFALPAVVAAAQKKAKAAAPSTSSVIPDYVAPTSTPPVWSSEGEEATEPPSAPRPVAVTAEEAGETLLEPPPLGPPEGPEEPVLSFAEKLGSAADVNIPPIAHSAYTELVNFISANPGHIDVDKQKQIVIGGKAVKNSNARDLFQSLYWPVRAQNKTGRLALFAALNEIGTPPSLILDTAAQKDYVRETRIESSPLRTRSQPVAAVTSRASVTPQKGKGRKRTASPFLSALAPPPSNAKRRARPPGTRLRVLRMYR